MFYFRNFTCCRFCINCVLSIEVNLFEVIETISKNVLVELCISCRIELLTTAESELMSICMKIYNLSTFWIHTRSLLSDVNEDIAILHNFISLDILNEYTYEWLTVYRRSRLITSSFISHYVLSDNLTSLCIEVTELRIRSLVRVNDIVNKLKLILKTILTKFCTCKVYSLRSLESLSALGSCLTYHVDAKILIKLNTSLVVVVELYSICRSIIKSLYWGIPYVALLFTTAECTRSAIMVCSSRLLVNTCFIILSSLLAYEVLSPNETLNPHLLRIEHSIIRSDYSILAHSTIE